MEVRGYFQKIRSVEESLPGDHVVVASLATADGGREGRLFELTRSLAAKMIVEKKVRLATEEESVRHREFVRGETAEVTARAVEPQTAFLAEISTIDREVKKQRKR
jgi:hypothetical protein